jgi:ribonuclease VapC
MVVDTSVILAIIFEEADCNFFLEKLADMQVHRTSAVSYVEASMLLISRRGPDAEAELDLMLQRAEIEIVPVSVEHAKLARTAFRRYGKGRHPAGLNFGDCFSYALARSVGEPLLFKGFDFSRTDIVPASSRDM